MNNNYRKLVESLQLVALPFERQTQVLPGFVCLADEVALIFDDIYRIVDGDEGINLPVSARNNLQRLDALFEEMSKNKTLWTDEALKDSPDWEEARTIALATLNEIDEPLSIPIMDSISFVKGHDPQRDE